jgi:hypothetical protein
MLIPLDWLREEGYAITEHLRSFDRQVFENALDDLEVRLSMRAYDERRLARYGCLDWDEEADY